eukprot:GHVS01022608.1.p1 GENE.GHVS01022608.1~~GHVS01022608.1.p1  ORF type:complete len:843 (+),score=102.75 GHVS01022608.1:321-2849(+)
MGLSVLQRAAIVAVVLSVVPISCLIVMASPVTQEGRFEHMGGQENASRPTNMEDIENFLAQLNLDLYSNKKNTPDCRPMVVSELFTDDCSLRLLVPDSPKGAFSKVFQQSNLIADKHTQWNELKVQGLPAVDVVIMKLFEARPERQTIWTHRLVAATRAVEGGALVTVETTMSVDGRKQETPTLVNTMVLVPTDAAPFGVKIRSLHCSGGMFGKVGEILTAEYLKGLRGSRDFVLNAFSVPTEDASLDGVHSFVQRYYAALASDTLTDDMKMFFTENASFTSLEKHNNNNTHKEILSNNAQQSETIENHSWKEINCQGINSIDHLMKEFFKPMTLPRTLSYRLLATKHASGGATNVTVEGTIENNGGTMAFMDTFLVVNDKGAALGHKILSLSSSMVDHEKSIQGTTRSGVRVTGGRTAVRGSDDRWAIVEVRPEVVPNNGKGKIGRREVTVEEEVRGCVSNYLEMMISKKLANVSVSSVFTDDATIHRMTPMSENVDSPQPCFWRNHIFRGQAQLAGPSKSWREVSSSGMQLESHILHSLDELPSRPILTYEISDTRRLVGGNMLVNMESKVIGDNFERSYTESLLFVADESAKCNYKIRYESSTEGVTAGGRVAIPSEKGEFGDKRAISIIASGDDKTGEWAVEELNGLKSYRYVDTSLDSEHSRMENVRDEQAREFVRHFYKSLMAKEVADDVPKYFTTDATRYVLVADEKYRRDTGENKTVGRWDEMTATGFEAIEEMSSQFDKTFPFHRHITYEVVRSRPLEGGAVHLIMEGTIKMEGVEPNLYNYNYTMLLERDDSSSLGYKIRYGSWIGRTLKGGYASVPTGAELMDTKRENREM